mmetsp:Transcript_25277/g.55408  ORF Transcript_25277/g.55408 Transcript_25277/m.55408 type:complete len:104 (+) Transcript_25277:384-695(+)
MKDKDNQSDDPGTDPIDPTEESFRQRVTLAVSRADANGGIPKYFGERALIPKEQDLRRIFTSLGLNVLSADKLFRNRISTIDKIVRMKEKELDGLAANINTNP